MRLIIAVNSNGTHSWAGFFHDRDWDNQKYRDEVYEAVKKTFRRLKLKNVDPITITEVDNVEPRTRQKESQGKAVRNDVQRGQEAGLASREALIQSISDAYLPRN